MTDEIIIPDAVFLKKEPIYLSYYRKNDTKAMRYTFNLKGQSVQVVQEKGSRDCSVLIGEYHDRVSVMDVSKVGDYVKGVVDE